MQQSVRDYVYSQHTVSCISAHHILSYGELLSLNASQRLVEAKPPQNLTNALMRDS